MPDCVAIIPVKGNSQRLRGKNCLPCAGVSLWRRALECALEAEVFTEIVLDSDLPLETFKEAIPRQGERRTKVERYARHAVLSADGVGVAAVVLDLLSRRSWRDPAFCVLWPTTPTRTPEVLQRMYQDFTFGKLSSLHSVVGTKHDGTAIFMRTLHFLWRLSLDYTEGMPAFFMDAEQSCDVNTAEDLARAEAIILAREAAWSRP